MDERNVLTKEGKKKLEQERDHLINVERVAIIEEIKEARSQGDLSENAEFDAARTKQGKIEERIAEIEKIILNSKVVNKKSVSSSQVRIGSKVKIKNIKDNSESTYTIVGTLEVDPFEGKISNQSPLALALIGKEVGAVITIKSLKPYDIKIISISN